MPKYAAWALFSCLCLWACSTGSPTPQSLHEEAVRVLALSGDEQAHEARARVLLDHSLRIDPGHIPSLLSRAELRIRQRDYAGALVDNDAALEVRRQSPTLLMMHCMLRERLGDASPVACYRNVIGLFRQPSCQEDLNCVIATSMAEVPAAQAYRDQYLAVDRPAAERAIAEALLCNFDRERYLRSVLP